MSEKAETAQWYVVHTYSGYENKVKANLEKSVENNEGLQSLIQEISIPVEEVVEIRNGKRHTIQRKIFPGYVLVKMIMNNETWYIVRNTRGVTGFVGPGSHPVPLKENEIEFMLNRAAVSVDIAVGEDVRHDGAFVRQLLEHLLGRDVLACLGFLGLVHNLHLAEEYLAHLLGRRYVELLAGQ